LQGLTDLLSAVPQLVRAGRRIPLPAPDESCTIGQVDVDAISLRISACIVGVE